MKRLDLRKDYADFSACVANRVQGFDPSTNDGPGKGKRVSGIDVGFDPYQSGWVCLVFDTRRNPEPGGEFLSAGFEFGGERFGHDRLSSGAIPDHPSSPRRSELLSHQLP